MSARLLCGECRDLQSVLYGSIAHDADVRLKCGHYRPTSLLPVAPGHISIEHLGTREGLRLFPVVRIAE